MILTEVAKYDGFNLLNGFWSTIVKAAFLIALIAIAIFLGKKLRDFTDKRKAAKLDADTIVSDQAADKN